MISKLMLIVALSLIFIPLIGIIFSIYTDKYAKAVDISVKIMILLFFTSLVFGAFGL